MDAEPQGNTQSLRATRSRKRAKNEPSSTSSTQNVEGKTDKRSKGIRMRKGILAGLPDLPLDILFEVLGNLGPYDLLKLARTSKEYRRLLMSKSSISVWKAALSHVSGLPPCPDDMSEPAYANLAFSPHCFFCLATARTMAWRLRVRICSKCTKVNLKYLGAPFESPIYKAQTNEMRLKLINLEYLALIPNMFTKQARRLYFPSALDDLLEKFCDLPESQRQPFLEERKKYMAEWNRHAHLCEQWAASQVQDRGAELRQLREDRKNAIVAELEELGLGDEVRAIKLPDSLENHKLVDRAQRLTPKIWTNIKSAILEFMDEMREKRLKREFNEGLFARKLIAMDILVHYKKANLDTSVLLPSPADFCEIPVIRQILHQAVDIAVDRTSFDEIIPQLPTLMDSWRSSLDKALENKFQEATSDEGLIATLPLASTVFACSRCDGPSMAWKASVELFFYPQVLAHRCLSRKSVRFEPSLEPIDPSLQLPGYGQRRSPWDGSYLSVRGDVKDTVEALVKCVGLDPATATVEEMDNLNARFHCQACITTSLGFTMNGPLFTWRAATIHFHRTHKNKKRSTVETAFNAFMAKDIPQAILVAEQELNDTNDEIWVCLHCQDTKTESVPMRMSSMKAHLKHSHQKDSDPVLNEDYCKTFAALDLAANSRSLFRVALKDGELEVATQGPMYDFLSQVTVGREDFWFDEEDFIYGYDYDAYGDGVGYDSDDYFNDYDALMGEFF